MSDITEKPTPMPVRFYKAERKAIKKITGKLKLKSGAEAVRKAVMHFAQHVL